MQHSEIQELIALAKREGLTSLKVENEKGKVEFSFSVSQHQVSALTSSRVGAPTEQTPQERTPKAQDPNVKEIRSPFVGTFYSSPAPGKAQFVSVGKRVQIGDTLCILEAMKVMNELESDYSGEIIEILVENEALVEYNQPLFKIRIS